MRLWHSLTDFSGDNYCSLSTYLCIIVAYFCIHFQSLKGEKNQYWKQLVIVQLIVCSHAIFMITAILLNSQNSHYIENKLQSLHVCIACKHVKYIRGSINTQSDSFMLIRCVGFMFRDYCFRDMAIQGAEVSFMLLKSVQETETYEECCDTFTIGESDCICY